MSYRPLVSFRLEPGLPPTSNYIPTRLCEIAGQILRMLEPHQRAALIPTEPGVPWHSFLRSRFVQASQPSGKIPALAIFVQMVQQQSPLIADIQGLVELSLGSALPVVSAFVGQLNLETREFSARQSQPDKIFSGQLSENGRVMVLREAGQSKQIHLVHEGTLAQLV